LLSYSFLQDSNNADYKIQNDLSLLIASKKSKYSDTNEHTEHHQPLFMNNTLLKENAEMV